MSFKREGDDSLLLQRLKHKRVNDLLGEHVPQDEAKLLSNGRLTCLICSHRPIFDTMNILVVHRKGKKHTAELHKYLEHKQWLAFREDRKIQSENLKKERQLKDRLLGPKISENNPNKYLKKKTIDITSKNPVGIYLAPSASSQVRRYLKDLPKKTPLGKVVLEQKESYPASEKPVQSALVSSPPDICGSVEASHRNKADPYLFSKHMSGWIRDRFGNLVRDPDAEFDSSDDECHHWVTTE